jgi:hypothetical protein
MSKGSKVKATSELFFKLDHQGGTEKICKREERQKKKKHGFATRKT